MKTFTERASYVLFLSLFAAALLFFYNTTLKADASVTVGQEYVATTTYAAAPNTRTLKAAYGALGQVTITGLNTGTMTFYDATTSNVSLRTGQVATSSLRVLADFPASAPAGTYTFDAAFSNGLLLVTSGLTATSSVMTK